MMEIQNQCVSYLEDTLLGGEELKDHTTKKLAIAETLVVRLY